MSSRLPTYFISHGGGPWPWVKDMLPGDFAALEESLQSIPRDLGAAPRAILAVSGHWEEREFTVQTHPNPPMYYDYGGFPAHTYRIQYPAPGSPVVAGRIGELLTAAGIPVLFDAERGFDHGVFAPLFVSYPNADVPILQLSLKKGYDPAEHLAVGRALAPLRDEGVLIVGSGFTYHNLRNFGPAGTQASATFERWLTAALVDAPVDERTELLLHWDSAPSARVSHPAEDHLIPLMVAVGAAEHEAGTRIYYETNFMDSITSASYRFGLAPAAAG
ncbi:MAG TPA: class III extradiol ring-cleavage dioxygenase [Ilumatobacteraceae bacterium]